MHKVQQRFDIDCSFQLLRRNVNVIKIPTQANIITVHYSITSSSLAVWCTPLLVGATLYRIINYMILSSCAIFLLLLSLVSITVMQYRKCTYYAFGRQAMWLHQCTNCCKLLTVWGDLIYAAGGRHLANEPRVVDVFVLSIRFCSRLFCTWRSSFSARASRSWVNNNRSTFDIKNTHN